MSKRLFNFIEELFIPVMMAPYNPSACYAGIEHNDWDNNRSYNYRQ